MPRTIAITGSASGMGAATAARLRGDGHRVIGVDLHDADVTADLSTPQGRAGAVEGVAALAGDALDGLVTFAGLAPLPSRANSLVVSVNFFGSVALLEGLRPLLARGDQPAAVAIASNATTCQPGLVMEPVEVCLNGDEALARKLVDELHYTAGYPISKMAVARWVRRKATGAEWAGVGITLNAVAPGFIDTPMTQEGKADPELAPLLEDFPLPVGRPGQPEELAAFVCYLLGPDARFFVGSVLFCDGGTDALLRADDFPAPWVLT